MEDIWRIFEYGWELSGRVRRYTIIEWVPSLTFGSSNLSCQVNAGSLPYTLG
jgi:hypothetical protein